MTVPVNGKTRPEPSLGRSYASIHHRVPNPSPYIKVRGDRRLAGTFSYPNFSLAKYFGTGTHTGSAGGRQGFRNFI
jgi:hypothetical protein